MQINLDQARALQAISQTESYEKAAQQLHKAHSSLVYHLKTLESTLGIDLLDRTQYRTQLTAAGKRVLEKCQKLIEAEAEVYQLCEELKDHWEPYLKIVFDGIVPVHPILQVLRDLVNQQISTRVMVFTDFLSGVESTFEQEQADFMLSILPINASHLSRLALPPIHSVLVAGAEHPLGNPHMIWKAEALEANLFLTVRGSDPRFNLSTAQLKKVSTFHVNDFASKKLALKQGMGFGWMPRYLIESEIEAGELIPIQWEKENEHTFQPHLYDFGDSRLGKAGKYFKKSFLEATESARAKGWSQLITSEP